MAYTASLDLRTNLKQELDKLIVLRFSNPSDQQHSLVTHVLTLNPNDFLGFSGITVVHPQEIIANDYEN